MTKSAFNFLLYLDRYLSANEDKLRELRALYLTVTKKKLDLSLLWRHRKRRSEPNLSTSLVYLVFLSQHGELVAKCTPGDLFGYRNAEFLKK